MRIITDFHLHSQWSRACSKALTLPNIAKACERKGIDLVGTSDAFHPAWRSDIGALLEEVEDGVFALKDHSSRSHFLLTTEISCIYKRGGKVRRVHHVIVFPSLSALDRLTSALLERQCNIKSDGRPIVGIDSEDLLTMALEADSQILFIPAHAWTPWFSIFGSKSGFDSLEECFGSLTKYIYAIETGLSSDPAMNWRLSALDHIFLVSNSDAHSLNNLGREANIFEIERLSFKELRRILVEHDIEHFLETIEFFPEEGKYHADGHAACNFWCEPRETKRLKGVCPKCGKPLTIGVLHRVAELADRPVGAPRPLSAVPFRSIVPLSEVVGSVLGFGKASKRVMAEVSRLLADGRSEFQILLDMPTSKLERITSSEITTAILAMREGKVEIRPGYDGVYGRVKVKGVAMKKQSTIF